MLNCQLPVAKYLCYDTDQTITIKRLTVAGAHYWEAQGNKWMLHDLFFVLLDA